MYLAGSPHAVGCDRAGNQGVEDHATGLGWAAGTCNWGTEEAAALLLEATTVAPSGPKPLMETSFSNLSTSTSNDDFLSSSSPDLFFDPRQQHIHHAPTAGFGFSQLRLDAQPCALQQHCSPTAPGSQWVQGVDPAARASIISFDNVPSPTFGFHQLDDAAMYASQVDSLAAQQSLQQFSSDTLIPLPLPKAVIRDITEDLHQDWQDLRAHRSMSLTARYSPYDTAPHTLTATLHKRLSGTQMKATPPASIGCNLLANSVPTPQQSVQSSHHETLLTEQDPRQLQPLALHRSLPTPLHMAAPPASSDSLAGSWDTASLTGNKLVLSVPARQPFLHNQAAISPGGFAQHLGGVRSREGSGTGSCTPLHKRTSLGPVMEQLMMQRGSSGTLSSLALTRDFTSTSKSPASGNVKHAGYSQQCLSGIGSAVPEDLVCKDAAWSMQSQGAPSSCHGNSHQSYSHASVRGPQSMPMPI